MKHNELVTALCFCTSLAVLTTTTQHLFAAECPSSISQGSTASCNIITKDGVTWTFDGDKTVGQFVTGDYWVVDAGSGVSVTISPLPSGGRNGSQVNPTDYHQAFDDRGYDYSSGLLFASGGVLNAGDSLISTVSDTNPDNDTDVLGRDLRVDYNSHLKTAAVLTVLSGVPASGSFRPPAFGTVKPIYNYNNINWSRLASLTHSTGSPSHLKEQAKSVVENYANYLSRLWINWGLDWHDLQIHPEGNMPNYYEYAFYVYSEAGLIINSDLPGKESVAIGLIQLGIDTYHVTNAGYGDRTVSKFPMLVAGILLGDPALYTTTYPNFKEILQTYYGTGWQTPQAAVLWRTKVGLEHEETHPNAWDTIVPSVTGRGAKCETYRRCCSSVSWSGIALSIRAMHAETEWGHNAFLDYVDRWHNEASGIDKNNRAIMQAAYNPVTWTTAPWSDGNSGDTESAFTSGMWSLHRATYNSRIRYRSPGGSIINDKD